MNKRLVRVLFVFLIVIVFVFLNAWTCELTGTGNTKPTLATAIVKQTLAVAGTQWAEQQKVNNFVP